MNISFAKTKRELLAGLKICTRRRWKAATAAKYRAGTLHVAWDKDTRVKGARRLLVIRATRDAYLERLGDMTAADLAAEGGMCETVEAFIRLVGGTPDEQLWVAWFEVVESLAGKSAQYARRRVGASSPMKAKKAGRIIVIQ